MKFWHVKLGDWEKYKIEAQLGPLSIRAYRLVRVLKNFIGLKRFKFKTKFGWLVNLRPSRLSVSLQIWEQNDS